METDFRTTPEPLQIDVRTAARMIGISKSFLYELMNNPAFPIRPVRIGSKVLFNRRELIRWVEAACPKTEQWENVQAVARKGKKA